jgi:hypothetical protein
MNPFIVIPEIIVASVAFICLAHSFNYCAATGFICLAIYIRLSNIKDRQ